MIKTVSLKALRPELPKIAAGVEKGLDRYIVTRHGRPALVILSPEDYESLVETIEILSDKAAVSRLRRARREARAGRTLSLDALRRRMESA